MPPSKKRDKERKRTERAVIRLDKQVEDTTVQPRIPVYQQGRSYEPGSKLLYNGKVITVPEFDADGYIVSE